jgi:hypothetical protein
MTGKKNLPGKWCIGHVWVHSVTHFLHPTASLLLIVKKIEYFDLQMPELVIKQRVF